MLTWVLFQFKVKKKFNTINQIEVETNQTFHSGLNLIDMCILKYTPFINLCLYVNQNILSAVLIVTKHFLIGHKCNNYLYFWVVKLHFLTLTCFLWKAVNYLPTLLSNPSWTQIRMSDYNLLDSFDGILTVSLFIGLWIFIFASDEWSRHYIVSRIS